MIKISAIQTEKDFDEHHKSEIWFDAAKEICRRHNFAFDEIKRAGGSEHIVFFIDDAFVLKIYRPFRQYFEREVKAIELVGGRTGFKLPEVVHQGEFEKFPYILMTRVKGELITRADWLQIPEKAQLGFISKLAIGLKQTHTLSPDSFENNWAAFVKDRAETFIDRQVAHGVNKQVLDALPAFIEENLKLVPTDGKTAFMHADVHFGNLGVVRTEKSLEIAGLFDFADSRRGFFEYDFLAVGVLMIQGQRKLQREFFRSYGYAGSELDEQMRKRLMMLTMLYETADLRRYAIRLKPEAVEFSLEELEKGIWSFV
ncbi:MAG: aminoglycoside phosphotransferase family protein [Pyrinomonadaceae bacterium]|nr:aminoglycoside phosphotransferase family protein [Pyrinomonadaceae bacterium]